MWPKYDKPFFFHDIELDNEHYKAITSCIVPTGVGKTIFNCGVAICSNEDSFNKKMGRRIAEGRARKYGHNCSIQATDFGSLKVAVAEMMEETLSTATALKKERLSKKA